jgi:hypothetical protein
MKSIRITAATQGNSTFLQTLIVLVVFMAPMIAHAQAVRTEATQVKTRTTLTLTNELIECAVVIDSNRIISEKLIGQAEWLKRNGSKSSPVETDADFKLEIMWTDWGGPKFFNNAENPVTLSKTDFTVALYEFKEEGKGEKELRIYLSGAGFPLLAVRSYRLGPNDFFVRQALAVADTANAGHFLQHVWPTDSRIHGKVQAVSHGGFGQPVALTLGGGGAFFGVEYPAAENVLQDDAGTSRVTCGHEVGEKIGKEWLESESVVLGLTPDADVKRWFMKYVDAIRIVPIRPYTLYNSWYDLRSAEYPKVPPANVMNETNVMRIIDLIRKNMIEKHNLQLDAFVLDDGWDVYESDWVLRRQQFPNGLKPIADELRKTGTGLGIWFGPTGGYSFRMKRVNWMKEHGYEVVGTTKNTAMLCLAGEHYSSLFRKRVVDFVANDSVGYFKWDGIQFSCSEPDHGHPIGIYSRRAVLKSLLQKCAAVHEKNPGVFLNITSGTWLSPWWVKYANQIWMQGSDYGYADVPSISPRDAAITYRDFVLYDDFKNRNWWFPIANLMTHGIIKGNLQMLGGKQEPLDKFTNEVLLYFARGVSMWELYISPDILNEGEWDALGNAMHWAKDRFPILSSTEMVGGDPTRRETYGYVHFNGSKGVIAARNPWIELGSLNIALTTATGIEAGASSLVLERVYPTHWIAPKLYRQGETVVLPLEGYEMAIYEMYPIGDADTPLLAGASYDAGSGRKGGGTLAVYAIGPDARLLNPEQFSVATPIAEVAARMGQAPRPVEEKSRVLARIGETSEMQTAFTLDASVREASLAILLTPADAASKKVGTTVLVSMDGRVDTARSEAAEDRSRWYTTTVVPGKHDGRIRIVPTDSGKTWAGTVLVWLICRQSQPGVDVSYSAKEEILRRPMPPLPMGPGMVTRNVRLGEVILSHDQVNPPR